MKTTTNNKNANNKNANNKKGDNKMKDQINFIVSENVVQRIGQESEGTFEPILVDLKELERIKNFFTNTAKSTKGSYRKVSFKNSKGLTDSKPLRTFILKGLPKITAGYESILLIEDYEQRLSALQRHEAKVRLFIEKKVVNYEEITPEILNTKIANIKQFKNLYR